MGDHRISAYCYQIARIACPAPAAWHKAPRTSHLARAQVVHRAALGPAEPEYPMSTARLPRKLKIPAWAAASICVSASLVAGAKPPAPQVTITSLAGSLAAVSAGSATDAWAVGQTRTTKTLALHWNGTNWAQALTPTPGAFGSQLSGVTEISPANVWAVGSANTSSGSKTLALHWNGKKWDRVLTPSPGISDLAGISAVSATDIWAVGSGGTTTRETTLVLHWDGRTWTHVPSPTPPGQVIALFAVSAVSATDVWAVGRDLTKTIGKALVLHWNGTAWTQVPSPDPGVSDNQLFGVHMTSATDGWAVGLADNGAGGALTLVLHWNGTAWTQAPSPTFGLANGGSVLTAVSGLTGSDAWASGFVFTNGGGEGILLLHWNGTSWTRAPSPSPSPGGPTGGSFLNGVDMAATADVWSAGGTFFDGTGRERTLLLHWNGTTWTRF
jgi:hypothetical protein